MDDGRIHELYLTISIQYIMQHGFSRKSVTYYIVRDVKKSA